MDRKKAHWERIEFGNEDSKILYGSLDFEMWVRYSNRNVQKVAAKWKCSSKKDEGEIDRLKTRTSIHTGGRA